MAANISELPVSSPDDKLNLVGRIRTFMVWIGGSLASITAIFYAVGYLITRAHLSMLGLHGVLDFDNHYIIQEGGKFFLVVGYATVSNVVLPLLAILGPLIVAAKVTQLLTGDRAHRAWRTLRHRLPVSNAHGWPRLLVFALLFLAFIWHAETFLLKFQHPLCIGNLLYADSARTTCPSAMMEHGPNLLKKALLERDEIKLNDAFQELVIGFALAVALAYFTWRTTLPWRWRSWYVAPSLLAAVLYLVLLPMDYGVLQRPINYPRVALTLAAKPALSKTGPLFLLNQTSKDFVVWDGARGKLFWIPTDKIERAEVDGIYNLFDSPPDRSATRGARR